MAMKDETLRICRHFSRRQKQETGMFVPVIDARSVALDCAKDFDMVAEDPSACLRPHKAGLLIISDTAVAVWDDCNYDEGEDFFAVDILLQDPNGLPYIDGWFDVGFSSSNGLIWADPVRGGKENMIPLAAIAASVFRRISLGTEISSVRKGFNGKVIPRGRHRKSKGEFWTSLNLPRRGRDIGKRTSEPGVSVCPLTKIGAYLRRWNGRQDAAGARYCDGPHGKRWYTLVKDHTKGSEERGVNHKSFKMAA